MINVSKASLAVDRMTDSALWARGLSYLAEAADNAQRRDPAKYWLWKLDTAEACFVELRNRGQQLIMEDAPRLTPYPD